MVGLRRLTFDLSGLPKAGPLEGRVSRLSDGWLHQNKSNLSHADLLSDEHIDDGNLLVANHLEVREAGTSLVDLD